MGLALKRVKTYYLVRERFEGVSWDFKQKCRGGSRAAATSKMERFVIIVNGFQPLTIITKRSILDVVAVLDPPLKMSPES